MFFSASSLFTLGVLAADRFFVVCRSPFLFVCLSVSLVREKADLFRERSNRAFLPSAFGRGSREDVKVWMREVTRVGEVFSHDRERQTLCIQISV